MRTRIFKSGNSQAVRIPKDLQLPPEVKEVDIEQRPWGFVIRHRGRRLTGLAAKFAAFGPDFLPEGRPAQGDEEERDWGLGQP
ncbi:MAG: AbrB/MazE/SpoVT family DNA-binding domain-containing protein [Sulfuritalea sp.]|nr:AbrB/MazE/SpoVT family DNA-binding domain-containing protein [Sulfuritalea sp.]